MSESVSPLGSVLDWLRRRREESQGLTPGAAAAPSGQQAAPVTGTTDASDAVTSGPPPVGTPGPTQAPGYDPYDPTLPYPAGTTDTLEKYYNYAQAHRERAATGCSRSSGTPAAGHRARGRPGSRLDQQNTAQRALLAQIGAEENRRADNARADTAAKSGRGAPPGGRAQGRGGDAGGARPREQPPPTEGQKRASAVSWTGEYRPRPGHGGGDVLQGRLVAACPTASSPRRRSGAPGRPRRAGWSWRPPDSTSRSPGRSSSRGHLAGGEGARQARARPCKLAQRPAWSWTSPRDHPRRLPVRVIPSGEAPASHPHPQQRAQQDEVTQPDARPARAPPSPTPPPPTTPRCPACSRPPAPSATGCSSCSAQGPSPRRTPSASSRTGSPATWRRPWPATAPPPRRPSARSAWSRRRRSGPRTPAWRA